MSHFFLPNAPSETISLPFSHDTPWLAPLAGYSDLAFRLLCREHGAACCTTEMISAKGLEYKSPGTARLLASTADDQPLVVQLFGAEADSLGMAVRVLRDKGYRFFDLNIGCSVPKVMRQGAGAGMLADMANLLRCAESMLREAGEGHVGFKLRLGLDGDHMNVVPELPLQLQEMGAGWITLHPRTARQGFQGSADWSVIRTLSRVLRIPVVASGDLFTAEDGIRCLRETGASCVMYARGALRSPHIFRDHMALVKGETPPVFSVEDLKATMCRHLDLIYEHASGRDQTARMRGILSAYARGLPNTKNVRIALCHCTEWKELYRIIREGIFG
ncbi:MAG: tRNA-dihydrouridine synthase family protein [Desulfovibrio sp.]|nr:tRNA-dihydrouridine synthase family protein [Desulfovibrio sp.]